MPNKMRDVFAPHIDFEFLAGIIPNNPKAQPCNIDGLFQRKDKFLEALKKYIYMIKNHL